MKQKHYSFDEPFSNIIYHQIDIQNVLDKKGYRFPSQPKIENEDKSLINLDSVDKLYFNYLVTPIQTPDENQKILDKKTERLNEKKSLNNSLLNFSAEILHAKEQLIPFTSKPSICIVLLYKKPVSESISDISDYTRNW
ncbi:hypothetical protein HZS_1602, partial [Henneguya salminicola]